MRKALEAPLALWIDLVLPKRLVLEIYLNIAEWGPNGEFGVEAGARRAFNKRTNNAERLHDPEYLGRRHERVIGQAYFAFVDQFVTAVKQELPRTCLQWEDFATPHARPILERYRDQLLTPIPRFVERDLRKSLECGILAHGFGKGRGVCPSCNTRRMAETARSSRGPCVSASPGAAVGPVPAQAPALFPPP